jgi:hypothetical protein
MVPASWSKQMQTLYIVSPQLVKILELNALALVLKKATGRTNMTEEDDSNGDKN